MLWGGELQTFEFGGRIWELSQRAGGEEKLQAFSAPEARGDPGLPGAGQCCPMRSPPSAHDADSAGKETPGISPSGFPLPEAHFQPFGEGRREGPLFGPSPETWPESPEGPTGSGTLGPVQGTGFPQPLSPLTAPSPLPRTRRVTARAPGHSGARPPARPPLPEFRPSPARTREAPGQTPGCRGQACQARVRSPRTAAPALGALPGDGRLRAPLGVAGRGGGGAEARAPIGRPGRSAPPAPPRRRGHCASPAAGGWVIHSSYARSLSPHLDV